MIFDKSVQIKQLTVVEAHGILLVRTDRGRDSRMHVFRLSSFESDACGSEPAAFSRQHLKDQRLERTKGVFPVNSIFLSEIELEFIILF